jgi:hypothetical protein
MASKLSKTTTDHEEIRRWVEERGGQPSEVASTARSGQPGILRIDFPGYSGEGKLKPMEWDAWFEKFDRSGLALVYQEHTAGGERSNFNKLVKRETAQARRQRGSRSEGSRSVRAASAARTARSSKSAGKSSSKKRAGSGKRARGASGKSARSRSRSSRARRS